MFTPLEKELWGFHPVFESVYQMERAEHPTWAPARVIFASHDHFRVQVLGSPRPVLAKPRGALLRAGERPVVGDWTLVDLKGEDHEFLPIEMLLPSKTHLSRGGQCLARNMDYVLLVTSFNRDLSLNRLERGLAMVKAGGAIPLIVLNKSDLMDESGREDVVAGVRQRLPQTEVFTLSGLQGVGVEALTGRFCRGDVVALMGMSGVGKSTLVNALLGRPQQKTVAIREEDARGRHATTHRELFAAPQGLWILDSPGIRVFDVEDEGEGVETEFADVTELFMRCRFSDCSHLSEPGCEVRRALNAGELLPERWGNYQKLQRELEFQANRGNKAHWSAKRKEWAKRSQRPR